MNLAVNHRYAGSFVVGVVVMMLTSPAALAVDITASLDHSSEYTTNSGRTQNDAQKEWIHSPGASVTVSQDTASLNLSSSYSYQHRYYQQDLFDDEEVTTGSTNLLWHVVDNRLDFMASNSRTESTERAIDADNPDNRQVVSNSTMGPTLRLQPRRGDELQLGYRFSKEDAGDTNTDSQRQTGDLSYILGLSESRSVTLFSSYSDIDYDDEQDTTSLTATLGYSQTAGDLTFDGSAGYSEFDRDGQEDTVSGGVYNLNIGWQARGTTNFTLSASRSINDQSSSFSDIDEDFDFDDPLNENSASNAIFTETTGDLTWSETIGPNTLTASVSYTDEDYDDADLDNERISTNLGFSRALTRTTDLTIDASYGTRDFSDEDDEQDDFDARFRVSHRFGRSLNVNWGVSYFDQDSDSGDSYDELRYTISLSYTILGAN